MGQFESIAEAQRIARKRLPTAVYSHLLAGAERAVTCDDNVSAFDELGFLPRIADQPAHRDLETTVMGQRLAMPVLASPTGAPAVHPEGEVATARATAACGTGIGLSMFASRSVEDVVAANPKTFAQLFWLGGRERMGGRLERMRAAGVAGLILTLDWSFWYAKDRGSPYIPSTLGLHAAIHYAPDLLRRPRWLASWARHGHRPKLTAPNVSMAGEPPTPFPVAHQEWVTTAPPTWDDIAWLRAKWEGPFMVKGVMHVDDARRAVDIGATAVSVSNHGGNNVDGTPASLRALPRIADAVGADIEILLDGGVRRGGDVVKALALGARAVLVGRAPLWGLAAGGEAGVENAFSILRAGIDSVLYGIACASVHDVGRDHVVVARGFDRGVGAAGSASGGGSCCRETEEVT